MTEPEAQQWDEAEERAEFELFMGASCPSYSLAYDPIRLHAYADRDTNNAWMGWLARRSIPGAPAAPSQTRQPPMRCYEVYETQDRVLPRLLTDAEECAIRIEFHYDRIILHVGARDCSWDRKTGELIGAGTLLDGGVADEQI